MKQNEFIGMDVCIPKGEQIPTEVIIVRRTFDGDYIRTHYRALTKASGWRLLGQIDGLTRVRTWNNDKIELEE